MNKKALEIGREELIIGLIILILVFLLEGYILNALFEYKTILEWVFLITKIMCAVSIILGIYALIEGFISEKS